MKTIKIGSGPQNLIRITRQHGKLIATSSSSFESIPINHHIDGKYYIDVPSHLML